MNKKMSTKPNEPGSTVEGGADKESKKGTVSMTPKQRLLRTELEELRSKCEELKSGGDIASAIGLVTKFEKKTRLALEYDICADAAVLLTQLYQDQGDLKALNTAVLTISKHRQQHRKVIGAMMKESMKFLNATTFADDKEYLDYLDTLRTVSAGKIYLEVEAARLTMRLAKHREKEGKTEEASKILLEVAVETYGTMDKIEKAEFLLEGEFRKGHYQGVTQIVKKLFDAVEPDVAMFGQKDFQQVLMIKNMLAYFQLPIKIITCPIIREDDGLAMSSRNIHLSPVDRENSLVLSKSLQYVTDHFNEFSLDELEEKAKRFYHGIEGVELDYFTIANGDTLEKAKSKNENSLVALVAAKVGSTRLIDNMIIK